MQTHWIEPKNYIPEAKYNSPKPRIIIREITNQKSPSLPIRNQHHKIEFGENTIEESSTETKSSYGNSNLNDANLDFLLSRQAINCSPSTIKWYKFTLGKILDWFEEHGVQTPDQISGFLVRSLLGEMAAKGYSDSYIHSYARVIRTFVGFLFRENYISNPITFQMPKLIKKKKQRYTEEDIEKILRACRDKRDRAFILLMIDSGLRRAEVIALNWSDIDLSSGIVRVVRGKGGKPRSVVIGIETRRVLLKYRSEINGKEDQPVFQTISGNRFTAGGLRSWLLRISKRTGINITPHALRRTFATLSIRGGMNLVHLQGLMGHASITTTRDYVGLTEEDLVKAHEKHGPVDRLLR